MTVTFTRSSWVIQCFFSTQMFSMTEIIAYPPPKVNAPILKKVRNKFQSIISSPVLNSTYSFF